MKPRWLRLKKSQLKFSLFFLARAIARAHPFSFSAILHGLRRVQGNFRGLLHSNPTKKDYETRFTGNTLCRRTARSLQRREPIGKGTSENGQTRQFGRAERS